MSPCAYALPEYNNTQQGSVSLDYATPGSLGIEQHTDRALVEWNRFNVGAGENVNIYQPDSSSILFNRVLDHDPSQILGNINANGNVWIINPGGVMFGSGAQVDVGGLMATTADMANKAFADSTGTYVFDQAGLPNAEVVNAGNITADVVGLFGANVNNTGMITAHLGQVELAATETFTIDFEGSGILNLALSPLADTTAQSDIYKVSNAGQVIADGGQIKMSVAQGNTVVSRVIEQSWTGTLQANTVGADDRGRIVLGGGAEDVNPDARTTSVIVSGSIKAQANNIGQSGGKIDIKGRYVDMTGIIDASGDAGGKINIDGRNVSQQAALSAKGSAEDGGEVKIAFSNNYIDSEQSSIHAGSDEAAGGRIAIEGSTGSRATVSGYSDASSRDGQGGTVAMAAESISLTGARIHADGGTDGGNIAIGGEYQGGGTLANAKTTDVNYSTTLSAKGTQGDGGQVVVWSDEKTRFGGKISATGNHGGGLIEISSKEDLLMAQSAQTDAASTGGGAAGKLLLDPKNIIIATGGTAGISYFALNDPTGGANTFGDNILKLSTGNIVVGVGDDDFSAVDAGAAYLVNGTTGAIISTLRGSSANDSIGSNLTSLTNGNYVVNSAGWDNGAVVDAGAVTWGNGLLGTGGVVSAANSVVGTQASDFVGFIITVLTNGNYVVGSTNWDNGAVANAGAVTWGNGLGGTFGAVSAANSLVGLQANDEVGLVTALTNGNYVVVSSAWRNGGVSSAGAVTWGNGLGGTVGAVSAANSLVGTTLNDNVGSGGITALNNGNYIVSTNDWDNGAVVDAGAVTWGNGLGGTVGAVSAANSLVGSSAGDQAGSAGITVLANNNYVVGTASWENGAVTNAGAATWGNGLGGTVGIISAANSLVGSKAGDFVGSSITALTNGNYVVLSEDWDNGPAVDAGAVTWGNGLGGTVGIISAANSLVGTTASDRVGNNGITALTNGNYVASSGFWDNGAVANAGAVTWGNGLGGTVGAVSAANSLVGTTLNDVVGTNVKALTNGNYVVASNGWDNGAVADAGAVTWGNGFGGTVGAVSAANSLVGSTANDQVGNNIITALTNGNYVVSSTLWNNGAVVDAGAVSWGNGLGGTVGAVSAVNSLVGTTLNDFIVTNITALTNGNYVVGNGAWDNGAVVDAGAATWGNGLGGTVGAVSAANSLVGSTAIDFVGAGIVALTNGNYVVSSGFWDNGAVADVGAATWGNGLGGTVGAVSAANSLVGSTANDLVGGSITALTNGNYVVRSNSWDNGAVVDAGAVTWGNGAGGTTGTITALNSIISPVASGSPGSIQQDTVNGNFIVGFSGARTVYFSPLVDGNLGYRYDADGDVTLDPAFITRTLNAGTAVTLQANNDITVNNNIIVNNLTGIGGLFTMQSGRSILLNANITTDDGNLNLYANDLSANGVVDAQRDAGNAVITMAPGTTINAGNGTVNIELRNGAGKTNSAAGDLTLANINAASISARNFNNTGDIVLTGGSLTATGAGAAATLVSARNFVNNQGAGALSTPAGDWLVYSTNPANNLLNGLASDYSLYSCAFGGTCPTLGIGNGLLYSSAQPLSSILGSPIIGSIINTQNNPPGSGLPGTGSFTGSVFPESSNGEIFVADFFAPLFIDTDLDIVNNGAFVFTGGGISQVTSYGYVPQAGDYIRTTGSGFIFEDGENAIIKMTKNSEMRVKKVFYSPDGKADQYYEIKKGGAGFFSDKDKHKGEIKTILPNVAIKVTGTCYIVDQDPQTKLMNITLFGGGIELYILGQLVKLNSPIEMITISAEGAKAGDKPVTPVPLTMAQVREMHNEDIIPTRDELMKCGVDASYI